LACAWTVTVGTGVRRRRTPECDGGFIARCRGSRATSPHTPAR
jgi:predicted RNA-binding Zn-ribbon protein involved in translation (DUF1610 family)